MKQRHWNDLSPGQRVATILAAAVQLTLAVTAWADLARRPKESVNGSKAVWAGVIAINFLGPIAYFARGRR
jgi:hypothetical protein